MPLWLEIIFASLSAISVVCSLVALWDTRHKNRISNKTIALQNVIVDDSIYDFENDELIKNYSLKFIIYNITNKTLIVSKCKFADKTVFNRVTAPTGIGTNSVTYREQFGIQVKPNSSLEIEGILRLNYDTEIKDFEIVKILFANGKELEYINCPIIKKLQEE